MDSWSLHEESDLTLKFTKLLLRRQSFGGWGVRRGLHSLSQIHSLGLYFMSYVHLEHRVGVEPTHSGFAIRRVNRLHHRCWSEYQESNLARMLPEHARCRNALFRGQGTGNRTQSESIQDSRATGTLYPVWPNLRSLRQLFLLWTLGESNSHPLGAS